MDWLRQAEAPLREWLLQQAWLDDSQSSIERTPDWALLATLLLFALLLRITRQGSRTSDTDTKPQAQKQSRQRAGSNVAPAPGKNEATACAAASKRTCLRSARRVACACPNG